MLKVACAAAGLDLGRPIGAAVYAAFVRDVLDASPDVELVEGGGPADAILSLDGRFRAARGARSVTVMHDIGHLVRRDAYRARDWWRQNWQVASAARRSDHLIAPSGAVAHGLAQYLAVPPARITLVEPLPRAAFRRAPRVQVDALRAARGLPERYFVFVGTRSRRKNLGLLGAAWAAASTRLEGGAGLVLAGPGRGTVPGAVDLGTVPAEDLAALISGALAWVCPSLYEGCAIGALEAMACGTVPVVSPAGALARTVDRAGIVIDPDSARDWADALVAIARRDDMRVALSNAARKAIAERREAPSGLDALRAALTPRAAAARG